MVPARVPPNRLVGHCGEGLEGALEDALGADVDPRAGGHLAVHREAEVLEPAELLPVGPVADQVGVGDQHPRRPLVGLHDPDRLAGLHEHRLVVGERGEGPDEGVVGLPVAGRLAGAAVDHEVLGTLGVLGVEVVHQHPQRRLGLPRARGQLGAVRGMDGETRVRALGHAAIQLRRAPASPAGHRHTSLGYQTHYEQDGPPDPFSGSARVVSVKRPRGHREAVLERPTSLRVRPGGVEVRAGRGTSCGSAAPPVRRARAAGGARPVRRDRCGADRP